MKSKKICFLVTDAISFNSLCRGQLEYFRDNGAVDMTLICGGESGDIKKLEDRNLGRVIDLGFVRQPSLVLDVVALFRLWFFFLFNRFDVVIYSTPKALLLGSLASFFSLQPKRIALVRGRVYENYVGPKRTLFAALDKVSLSISQTVLFISQSLKEVYLAEKLVSPKKAIVLGSGSSNGVDVERFATPLQDVSPDSLRSSLGFRADDIVVVMVGRVCPDKGISDLSSIVKAVANPALKFLVIGAVEDKASGQILEDLLLYSGRVAHLPHSNDIPTLFAMADIHLFLSHREGFGNVAIEAAAASVPTIAYDVVGVRDSVNAGISGVRVPFRDTDAIVQILEDAARDLSGFLSRFSEASRWASESFAQRVVWERYLAFYLNACV